ncbi:MAG: ATP synthase F1 subunit gamma [Acidimicrobiales bacterium]
MAGGQERLLRRRIRSVNSTRKTTRAMELIAGSRIVRAQQRIVAARPYAESLDRLAADIASVPGGLDHPLLGEPEAGSGVAVVVIAGDRGLSGAYNANVLRRAESVISGHRRRGVPVEVLAVGRRAQSYLRFRGSRIDHLFTGLTDRPLYSDAASVAADILAAFEQGRIGSAGVVSTRFRSMGLQSVESRRLLPLEVGEGTPFDYETEPERGELLELLMPRLIESRLFLALLEATASEHAARQRAMKAATDNADELIRNLRRIMNRARQDAITTEIMDIVGGAEALRQAAGNPLPPLPEHAA